MVFQLSMCEFFRTIIIIFHEGSWTTESSHFADFAFLRWVRHEVAWLDHYITFLIFEVFLDVNSFLCMFKRWFVTKLHDLGWTENFLMASSCNFIIILFSADDSCSNLLEGLTTSIVWCSLWQQNSINCWSFLDRVRGDLFWSSDYSTFRITAGYRIQMLALLFVGIWYVTTVTHHFSITYLSFEET